MWIHEDMVFRALGSELHERLRDMNGSITPNLRHLIWDVADHQLFFSHLRTYVTASIKHLALHPHWTSDTSISLRSVCPDLQRLDLLEAEDAVNVTRDILGIPSVNILDTACHDLRPTAFLHLSTLSNLHSLTFPGVIPRENVPPHDLPIPPPDQSTPFFPTLRKLNIGSVALPPCSRMLRALSNPQLLEELSISHTEYRGPCIHVPEYLDTIRNRLDSQTLSKFKLDIASGAFLLKGTEDPTSYRAIPATLQPLLTFSNMQDCEILLQELDCDDDFLASIASSWPRLRRLSLLSHPWHQEQSHFTLRGLFPLARGCPRLTYLALNMMPQTGEELRLEGLVLTWSHRSNPFSGPLTMWLGCLGHVAAGKDSEVARYLKTIFPNVRDVSNAHVNYWINHDRLGHMEKDAYADQGSPVARPNSLYIVALDMSPIDRSDAELDLFFSDISADSDSEEDL
ncbi:hypothetical protein EWM64_g5413 [Hericium alpestre]|uniref:F-box domain-containing protein n=1 Tax=Hericium alpestre TaxID=135208 RepID=A0A4Y9ZYM4_9AGAM|nr:hypothetical protein EWM64_g5413 [Hericium alpestre]